jgi:hypothetical protein
LDEACRIVISELRSGINAAGNGIALQYRTELTSRYNNLLRVD